MSGLCGGHEGGGTCPLCVAGNGTVRTGFTPAPDLRPDYYDIERDEDLRRWREARLDQIRTGGGSGD